MSFSSVRGDPRKINSEPELHEVWKPIRGSGRLWEVVRIEGDEITLYPQGSDVRPAQTGGQMHGGVRRIIRTKGVLMDRWVPIWKNIH